MSKKGIEIAALAFSTLQEIRQALIKLGTDNDAAKTKEGRQDILLGQLMDEGKEAMKMKFCKIIEGGK